MGQIHFLFAIHNHQPVGNFEWVFKDAMDQCYEPFLDVLSDHPRVKIGLHHTGPLFEWIEKHRPKYLSKIKSLCDRAQVELLGGAFYEPLISTLFERDAIGQIHMMSDYLETTFGVRPRGMWLAERVWEPQLASIVHEAGLEFTLLDDTHFYYAGLKDQDMFGYYITEDKGKTLKIFPINKNLRYLIPFNVPEKTTEYLGSAAIDSPGRAVTLGDDGEKFGLWPGTHDWVYNQKYLDKLFSLIEENAHWVQSQTFSEYLDTFKPMGRIYLPTASYEEMMEWSLPTEAQKNYHHAVADLQNQGQLDRYKPFIRGGFWRNFFSKYPESNLMHKKGIHVSNRVHQIPDTSKDKKIALRELWQGQCNCPYWHGLFGGLYLNYLRYANYSHLIEAEKIALKYIQGDKDYYIQELDYNCDGYKEIMVSSASYNLYLQPHYGGSICELDLKEQNFNLTNVLTRREEAYHEKIAQSQNQSHSQGQDGKPKSIHDIAGVKEEGLDRLLFYDWYDRFSLLDHFIAPGTSFDDFYRCQYSEEGDFVNQPYSVKTIDKKGQGLSILLSRDGHIFRQDRAPFAIHLQKKICLDSKNTREIVVEYTLSTKELSSLDTWFGNEFNLTMLDGNNKKRFIKVDTSSHPVVAGSKGQHSECKKFEFTNEEDHFSWILTQDKASQVWHFPLETMSQSESGVERTYQGTAILFFWPVTLQKDNAFSVKQHILLQ